MQVVTRTATSINSNNNHILKGIITGIDVYNIEPYSCLLALFVVILRMNLLLCCVCAACCMLRVSIIIFPPSTPYSATNATTTPTYNAMAIVRITRKRNLMLRMRWKRRHNERTKQIIMKRKKNTRASHRSAKEIKLFILYGADKKRIFTHSATNKVICWE